MDDLAKFLAARLDEDEAAAKDAGVYFGPHPETIGLFDGWLVIQQERVLREVEAKRAVLGAYEAVLAECATMLHDRRPRKYGEHDGLRLAVSRLAAVYSDHPDYAPAEAHT